MVLVRQAPGRASEQEVNFINQLNVGKVEGICVRTCPFNRALRRVPLAGSLERTALAALVFLFIFPASLAFFALPSPSNRLSNMALFSSIRLEKKVGGVKG